MQLSASVGGRGLTSFAPVKLTVEPVMKSGVAIAALRVSSGRVEPSLKSGKVVIEPVMGAVPSFEKATG